MYQIEYSFPICRLANRTIVTGERSKGACIHIYGWCQFCRYYQRKLPGKLHFKKVEMKNDDLNGPYSPGSSGWTSLRNPEFQEADVWEVFGGAKAPDSVTSFDQDPSSVSKRLPNTATRTIPKPNKTSDYSKGPPPKISEQHSAPVNIPDWSKIYGSSSKNTTLRNPYSWIAADDSDVDNADNHRSCESEDNYGEEDQEKWNDVIPPHEWIARKVSRCEMFSFSVCEGAGRTLKGRDLSRVRNAVLTRTGFLESNSRH